MLSSDHQNVYESILSLQLFFVNLRGALKPYHLWLIKVVINSNRRKLVFSVKHIICCKDTLLRYIIWCHQMSTTYIWGFHLGLWPNLNPLLILSQVDIVLSGRSPCSLPPTVCVLCDSSQVNSAAKSLRVTKRTQWGSHLIVPATYTSILFALVYIDGILQPAKRLLVQFPCLSFYKYISLVIVKVAHDSTPFLKVLVLRTLQFLVWVL